MGFSLDEKFIIKTEKSLSVIFPDSFRKKMMIDNGGHIQTKNDDFELYPFFDTSEKKRIKRTCNHIEHETKLMQQETKFPEGSIVIGHNGCGDLLIFKLINEKKLDSKVYIFNHETRELNLLVNDFEKLSLY